MTPLSILLPILLVIARGQAKPLEHPSAPSPPTSSPSSRRVVYGTAYQDGGFLYTEGQYHGPVGSRGYSLIYDNVSHDFIFREVSSAYMGYLPHDTHGQHWGHLELRLQRQCIGPARLGREESPLVLSECLDDDDASQLGQWWRWNDRTNRLTFLGQRDRGNVTAIAYALGPVDPIDDTLRLLDHDSAAHTYMTLGVEMPGQAMAQEAAAAAAAAPGRRE